MLVYGGDDVFIFQFSMKTVKDLLYIDLFSFGKSKSIKNPPTDFHVHSTEERVSCRKRNVNYVYLKLVLMLSFSALYGGVVQSEHFVYWYRFKYLYTFTILGTM